MAVTTSRSAFARSFLCIAAGVLGFAGSAPGMSAPRPQVPRFDRLGANPFALIHDRVLTGRTPAVVDRAASHGGAYTTSTGEQVKVYVSDAYPVDDSVNQHWADFMAQLIHGRELAKVTVYIAPLPEVQALCRSTEADGCYLFAPEEIVVPGEVPPDGAPVEEIVAHEYGHHIALNRSNYPWPAVAWGTKRWSSYENVCGRVLAHTAFPGDEGANYLRNPGEAFAESYRVLNDRRAPLAAVQLPWQMDGFNPDPTALALLQQDVLTPWTGSTITHWRGRVEHAGVRRLIVSAPRDGVARFVLSAPQPSAIAVFDPATGKIEGGARVEVRYGLCGRRKLGLEVLLARPGQFSVFIARP